MISLYPYQKAKQVQSVQPLKEKSKHFTNFELFPRNNTKLVFFIMANPACLVIHPKRHNNRLWPISINTKNRSQSIF